MPFQAIETQRLYQHVAQQIAELIRSGELPPGERLPAERDLAKRVGVSRPTIREAMIALEIAGLVEVRTGSGVYVRPPPFTDDASGGFDAQTRFDVGPSPFELLGARVLIEPEIAALAARQATHEAIDAIAATIWSLVEAHYHLASLDADQQFHSLIASATGNSVVVTIVQNLWANMSSPVFEALSARTGLTDTDKMTIADHEDILKHITAHEPERARAAMCQHLKHVEAILASSDDPRALANASLPTELSTSDHRNSGRTSTTSTR